MDNLEERRLHFRNLLIDALSRSEYVNIQELFDSYEDRIRSLEAKLAERDWKPTLKHSGHESLRHDVELMYGWATDSIAERHSSFMPIVEARSRLMSNLDDQLYGDNEKLPTPPTQEASND